jgi:hypothetical protein
LNNIINQGDLTDIDGRLHSTKAENIFIWSTYVIIPKTEHMVGLKQAAINLNQSIFSYHDWTNNPIHTKGENIWKSYIW